MVDSSHTVSVPTRVARNVCRALADPAHVTTVASSVDHADGDLPTRSVPNNGSAAGPPQQFSLYRRSILTPGDGLSCAFNRFAYWETQPSPRGSPRERSEEHTSELQSRENLVCRL